MDKDRSTIISAIALNSALGYEPRVLHRLIDELGSAEAILALSPKERADIFGPYSNLRQKLDSASLELAEQEYENLLAKGYKFCTLFDECYPANLRECPDAPILLYIRGTGSREDIFRSRSYISIVGTRDISPYGKEWCERIVHALSTCESKPVIVSGLAIGVDICAHMAALAHGLDTIAVSPVGIDSIYPRRHSVAAEKICSRSGSAVVTDYPPGSEAVPYAFLRRNRIIAGLSTATILIESKIKGGGAMTARLAADYGRNVFALPGRIDDIRSAACNVLIAEQLAEAIAEIGRLPEKLGLGKAAARKKIDCSQLVRERLCSLDSDLLDAAILIASLIKNKKGINIDEICINSGLSYALCGELVHRLEAAEIISIDLFQNCSINLKIA